MRITIESTIYENKRRVVLEENSDDLDITAAVDMVADALIAYGYAAESVRDATGGEDAS